MIRRLEKEDINRVADIWLDTNQKAHDFISADYWKSNFDFVKEQLLQAEVYVYTEDEQIQGFIGMMNTWIEGIFVSEKVQSQGIGTVLLNFVKNKKSKLYLHVYEKNVRALHFYLREGFEIQEKDFDEGTGEREYLMMWQCRSHSENEPGTAESSE